MRLSEKAMTIVSALLWGAGILLVGLIHLAIPAYGKAFLDGISSVYPGFHGARSFTDALVGTGYALLDGGIGGFILARLYNLTAQPKRS
jgi:hypothetical protein